MQIPLQELQKRVIFHYIEEEKDLANFFKTYKNLGNKKSRFNIFVPELHELFNVILNLNLKKIK